MTAAYFEGLIRNNIYSYHNRTRLYINPVFKAYGNDFVNNIRKFSTMASGIGDADVYHDGIFFLFNVERSNIRSFLKDFIYFRRHHSYIDDYLFGDLVYSKLHMLVLKLPPQYRNAKDAFVKGAYSQMYNEITIKKYFPEGHTRSVLLKDRNAIEILADNLNVSPEIIVELDEKPQTNEVFNCGFQSLDEYLKKVQDANTISIR